MEDTAKDAGPIRPLHPNPIPPDYEHDFDKKNICKRCGAFSYTKGYMCTGKK